MAFHVACPITCRRICYCPLGFPRAVATDKAKAAFLDDVIRVHGFLLDPTGIRARDEGKTVQVAVPRVAPPPPPPQLPVLPSAVAGAGGDSVAEDEAAAAAASAQAKRSALQRKAAADMVAAEDFARRFESGYLSDTLRGPVGEEQAQSNVNIMCRICFCGENEGSDRARRMLPCKTCGKKYHRNCIKGWSQHRDLFNWSSWTCPLCRICEVCRRTGDPNKLMFCKRCDGAYHCYCQHPSHKNVTPGPYCCPKHTKCHSCGSKVPGNGLSVRWFLGYTCCDACGRLFSKGNYCPVCLKVYRDSESTPMVCCDVCQRWVHCHCDGISDQRYQQFQLDGNLQYKCATCRGECCQIKNNEDAVKELWRRKDIADRDLISSLRAVAGLPAQEEIYSVSPYSDDDDNGPQILKNEFARPLKLSLKGLVDKSPKKTKDSGKKSAHKMSTKKKEYQDILIGKTEANQSFLGHEGPHSFGSSLGYDQNVEMQSYKNAEPDAYYSPIAGSLSHTEEICSVNKPGVLKHRFVNEVMVSDEDRTSKVRIKGKSHGLDGGEDGGKTGKSKPVKGKKLVINFGARKINITNSPRSDASPCQREEDLVASNGGEDASQQRTNVLVDRHDTSANYGDAKDRSDSGHSKGSKVGGREGNFIKLGKVRSGASDLNPKLARRGDRTDGSEPIPVEKTQVLPGKSVERGKTAAEAASEVPAVRHEKVYTRKQSHSRSGIRTESNKEQAQTPVSHSSSKDTKPLLKFKLKKPNLENQSSHQEEEKSYAKGQRSKRKRPSMEKTLFSDNDDRTQLVQDNLMDEIMDANWILKKLGKDAIGKRVEVQQLSDNSWHKGVVTDIIEGTSTLSVTLDDGKVKSLELGKQGVRFISQKQKRSKT